MPTVTVPEQLIAGEFITGAHQANNTGSFTLTLTSSVWETQPGVVVTLTLEQSQDNGATWTTLSTFEALSGPLGAPPHDGMPSLNVTYPNVKGNRRLRLRANTTAPILLGAVIESN